MVESKRETKKLNWLNNKVVGTVQLTKILILSFAAQSYQIITDQPLKNFYDYFGNWRRWDATHYLNIAQNGYTALV